MYVRSVRRIMLLCLVIAVAASLMMVPLIAQADSAFCNLSYAYKEDNTVRAWAYTTVAWQPQIMARVEVTLWKRYYENWEYCWREVAFAQAQSSSGFPDVTAYAEAVLDLPPHMLSGYYKTSSYHEIYANGQLAGTQVIERGPVYLDFDVPNQIEDFEWGDDGDSLATSQGEVEWTVYGFWGSSAEIDEDVWYLGTRSAKIHKGPFMVYASYEQFQPDYIGCYLMKDATSYPYIANGDGYSRICMHITSSGAIQYKDDAGWQDTESQIEIDPGTWYLIELRNISWIFDRYDIYVDGDLVESWVPMYHYSCQDGRTYYGNSEGIGNFWIDVILE